MCGISLACDFAPAGDLIGTVRAMHERIPHRGPDGEGWLAVDVDWRAITAPDSAALRASVGDRPLRLVAAFRWLKIQDLRPESGQPMGDAARRVYVLFNGEIYNHVELRDELTAAGARFSTASDTEVLLRSYCEWGDACVERLNGMWGAALIDLGRRTLTLTRDRFGIRPLVCRRDGARLLVASEVKQLTAIDPRPAGNVGALSEFLLGRRLDSGETFFRDVRPLPVGSCATISLESIPPVDLNARRFWSLEWTPEPPMSVDAASRRLEDLLQDAVVRQGTAAVPVGAMLSGGLDSSVLSSLLVETRRQRHERTTLISVTPDLAAGEIDERPYQQAVADSLAGPDLNAVEIRPDGEWASSILDRATWHQEEPIAGLAVLGHLSACNAAAQQGLRVILEGTGSDEIFGGYPRHQLALIKGHLRRRAWRSAGRELVGAYTGDRIFRGWLTSQVISSTAHRTGIRRARQPEWLRAEGVSRRGERPPARDVSTLSKMSHVDLTAGNVPAVLAITDRNAMAYSIESRVPFLDHRLVEFAFRLPDVFKTSGGRRKIVLRCLARRRLPAPVVDRQARVGFGMPGLQWLRGSFAPALAETMEADEVHKNPLLDGAEVRALLRGFLDGRDERMVEVWRIFALTRWMRAYGVVV